jgi:hypothetical protein
VYDDGEETAMTTTVVSPATRIAAVPEAPIYRLSPEQYLAMGDAGILAEDEKVELLEGVIVEKMTRNPPHMVACSLLLRHLTRVLPGGWFLAMQGPVTTADSLPEPDAAVIRGGERDYITSSASFRRRSGRCPWARAPRPG